MSKQLFKRIRLGVLLVSVSVVGCTAVPVQEGQRHAQQGEWLKAVIAYRKAQGQEPESIEIKSLLQQAEARAAEFYYQKGLQLRRDGRVEAALEEFQKGLVAQSDNEKLRKALEDALREQEANKIFNESELNLAAGRNEDAAELLRKAIDLWPEHKAARQRLDQLDIEVQKASGKGLKKKDPITVNFRNTDLKTAYEFLAKAAGMNVVIDEDAKSGKVTFFAENMAIDEVLRLMAAATKTFYKQINTTTFLVAPDTKEKRGQYEDYLIRTFHIKIIPAKEMADLIKGIMKIDKIVVNEQLNSLIIREREEVLSLLETLIATNDRKPAEMTLDVEILEVNRNKAEQLGLDFGSTITARFPEFQITGSWRKAFEAGTATLPNITFRYFKQDVDAQTLANPKIRVVNRKDAKIHIGDRVPLRSSTIQDATGQTRTTFEYKDIGIRLTILPDIHLDNSVTVRLALEVSTLGQNLGTQAEPAFSIGTRNAETYMLLRDGETAILGGLIRDEERRTRVKVPGLGDIPVLGALFTTFDDSSGKTDVLLTITPRVVRPWDIPSKSGLSVYSGNATHYSTTPILAAAGAAAGGVDGAGQSKSTREVMGQRGSEGTSSGESAPVLEFDKALYEARVDEEFVVILQGRNIDGVRRIPAEIIFNTELLEFVGVASAKAVEHGDSGIRIGLELETETNEVQERVTFRGKKPGISYLMYRVPKVEMADGTEAGIQVRAARVAVRMAEDR